MARIRVGIGGWIFAPWRGSFYPPGLPQARELEYASTRLTSIEINATFYGAQKPSSFQRWRSAVPSDFVFSVKAPRMATHRRDLADAAPTIDRFLNSGITELGDALGPILWPFPPSRHFDPDAFAAFLALLPPRHGGRDLRHVLEVRHPSFATPAFPSLLRHHGVACAIVDSERHPLLADPTADFMYARLERTSLDQPDGYAPAALDAWARRFRSWAAGRGVADVPPIDPAAKPARQARDCFVYFISGAKIRAPAAALALLRLLPKP